MKRGRVTVRRNYRRAATVILSTVFAAAAPSVAAAAGGSAAAIGGATVNVVAGGSTCSSFYCFKPALVKVANNSRVTWINQSGVTHSITRCTAANCAGHGGGTGTDSGFGIASLGSGQQYAFTFDAPGTYVYYCTIHGYAVMHGTVSVH